YPVPTQRRRRVRKRSGCDNPGPAPGEFPGVWKTTQRVDDSSRGAGNLRSRSGLRADSISANQKTAGPPRDERSLEYDLGNMQNVPPATRQVPGDSVGADRDLHDLLLPRPEPLHDRQPAHRLSLLDSGDSRLVWRGVV